MIWSGNVLRILEQAEELAEALQAEASDLEFDDYSVAQSEEVLRSIDFSSHPDAENFKTRPNIH